MVSPIVAFAFLVMTFALWVAASAAFGNPFCAVRRRLLGAFLLEHIGVMARLALPLAQGLSACKIQPSRGSRTDLSEVEDGLREGLLVGDALARVPHRARTRWQALERAFQAVQFQPTPRLVTAAEAEVLRIAEMSGDLAEGVQLVLDERGRFGQLRNWLYAALVYPMAVLIGASSMVTGILIFIVPKFKQMFDEFDITMPATTERLFRAANSSIHNWNWLMVLPLVLAGIVVVRMSWARPLMRGCSRVGESLLRVLYMVPFSLGITRRVLLAEFSTELAMLFRVGAPAHRALRVVAEGTMNPWFRDRVRRAAELCERGSDLATALDQAQLDRRAAWFSRAARDAASLAESLHRLADDYRSHVSCSAAIAIRLVPLIIILGASVAVGYVVIALFLPLVALMTSF